MVFFCDQDPDRLCILETSRSYDLSPSCIHKLKNTDASIQQFTAANIENFQIYAQQPVQTNIDDGSRY